MVNPAAVPPSIGARSSSPPTSGSSSITSTKRGAEWYKAQTTSVPRQHGCCSGHQRLPRQHTVALDPAVKVVLPITGVDIIAAPTGLRTTAMSPHRRILGGGGVAGGSNAWAIASSRPPAATLLLANPHLPWAPSQLTYYEAQLEGPSIHMYGATQLATQCCALLQQRSWIYPIRSASDRRYSRLTLADGDYVRRQRFCPSRRKNTIRVKQDDGSVKDDVITIRSTVQGPVFVKPNGDTIACVSS